MLTELHIENFALIESQSLRFGPGLTVISGETGAGKSIVLQALQFLLGGRAKPQVIRTGCEEAEVQGLFDLQGLGELVKELPEIARSDELVITRSVNSSGKNRILINGKLGTLQLLEEIMSRLVNVCSQSQQVRLLDRRYHIEVIDATPSL